MQVSICAILKGMTIDAPTDSPDPSEERPTLGKTGQIFVTAAAARQFAAVAGYHREQLEHARQELTALLIDAKPRAQYASATSSLWRARRRSTALDLTVEVTPDLMDNRLLLVVRLLHGSIYDPPPGGMRRRGRRR